MKAKWTPGPWTVAEKPNAYWSAYTIYQIGQSVYEDFIANVNEEPNARLIALAPEMAEALATVRTMLDGMQRTPEIRKAWFDNAFESSARDRILEIESLLARLEVEK